MVCRACLRMKWLMIAMRSTAAARAGRLHHGLAQSLRLHACHAVVHGHLRHEVRLMLNVATLNRATVRAVMSYEGVWVLLRGSCVHCEK